MTIDTKSDPISEDDNNKLEDRLKTNLKISLLSIIVGVAWAWISVTPAQAPPLWTYIAVGFGVIWFVITRVRMWRYKRQLNKVFQSTASKGD